MTTTHRRHRGWLTTLAVPTVAVVALGGAAWACTGTQPGVVTKITKPLSKSGPPGTIIKAKTAPSATIPVGWQFDLLFSDSAHNIDGVCHHGQAPPLAQTTSVAVAGGKGQIPGTPGTVPALTPKGQALVCFAKTSNYGTYNTVEDFFTVT